jgi:hypothetical protein
MDEEDPRRTARKIRVQNMYLPENDDQMYDILSALRTYAAANDMPRLAESIDDALVLLTAEIRLQARRVAGTGTGRDKR